MPTRKVNGAKLKEAIHKFGSLAKAIDALDAQKQKLEKDIAQLSTQRADLEKEKPQQLAEIEDLRSKIRQGNEVLQMLEERLQQHKRQYDLFEGFLAMIFTSPSSAKPVPDLIAYLQKAAEAKWHTTKEPSDLRSLFVRIVLGDYLKCFRCSNCGASFIVNREPRYQFISNYYVCPACHCSSDVQGDDGFLKAMVSEQQVENTRRVEEFKAENDRLKPLKTFLDLPCDVCGKPMTAWTKEEAERAVTGGGCRHRDCWSPGKGYAKQLG